MLVYMILMDIYICPHELEVGQVLLVSSLSLCTWI